MHGSGDASLEFRSKSGHLARVEVNGYVWKPSDRPSESTRRASCVESKRAQTPVARHDVNWRRYILSSGTGWDDVEFMAAFDEEFDLEDITDKDVGMPTWESRHHGQDPGQDCVIYDNPLRNHDEILLDARPSLKCCAGDVPASNNHTRTPPEGAELANRKVPGKRRKTVLLRMLRWFSCGQLPAEPEVKMFIKGAAGDASRLRHSGQGTRSSSNLYRARHQAFMRRVKDSMSGDEDFRASIPSPTFFQHPAFDLHQQTFLDVESTGTQGETRKVDLDSANVGDHQEQSAAKR